MKYKLRKEYSTDAQVALYDILQDRGVQDIENFIAPSKKCELNPYDLDNIEAAANLLLMHLRQQHKILFIIDCD